MKRIAAVLLALASACNPGDKDPSSADTGDTSASATSATTSPASSSAGTAEPSSGGPAGVDCGASPPVFPEFDRTCATVDDCVIVLHTDCCGPLALGLNKAEEAGFAAAEAICGPQCPPLGCDHPTIAEDGDVSAQDGDIQVECAAGKCTTFIP